MVQPVKSFIVWVLYEYPTDYPESYVARKWVNDKPTDEIIISENADVVRSRLPEGLVMVKPDPQDDPCILEVWF